jgi:hypothetical protein
MQNYEGEAEQLLRYQAETEEAGIHSKKKRNASPAWLG